MLQSNVEFQRTSEINNWDNGTKMVVIFTNFGPYHMARIRALTRYFTVDAIELASYQRMYGWVEDKKAAASIHTLCFGAWEEQNRLLIALRLWRKLDEIRPRVILVPGYASAPALAAALWGRLHGCLTVVMSESNAEDYPRKWLVELAKRKLITWLFDGAVVGGKRARRYMAKLGMRGMAVAVGYDVVDNAFFTELVDGARGSLLQRTHRVPFFLYVGRMASEKNISTLLKAFSAYREQGGQWSLVLVGDGPLADILRQEAGRLSCSESIVFAGYKTASELISFYAHAGCFVLPSKREPWGLVVNEALAAGLPVIVSSHCGCSDDLVEPNCNGFLIDPDEPSQLSQSLRDISQRDPESLRAMGARSREIIREFSPEAFAYNVSALVHNTLLRSN